MLHVCTLSTRVPTFSKMNPGKIFPQQIIYKLGADLYVYINIVLTDITMMKIIYIHILIRGQAPKRNKT